jgi:transcriptional regulator PpsR
MPHSAPDLSPLSPWAPELAQAFVTLASDIALVLDERGVIRNVVQGKGGGDETLLPATHDWVGRPWADTVSADTRVKIDALLSEVTSTGLARRREINHPLNEGASVAIAYTAVRLGHTGPVLAVGRDLRAIGAIQQRFLEAQREMERGYWKVRQAEARYRLLFQVATDAVLMVDAERRVILEANPAAVEMFESPLDQMLARELPPYFLFPYRQALNDLMSTVCESGQPAEIRARLAGRTSVASVAVTPLRTDDQQRLLVRVRLVDLPGAAGDLSATISRLVDSASDGVLVSDPAGHVLLANPAFLRLVRLNTEMDVKGRPLTDWVGISDEDFVHLLHQVRREGLAQRMASRVVTADAQMFPVEITAALLTEGDQECIGFTVHHAAPAVVDERLDGLQAAVAELAGRIGETPLPELLQRAALLLEQHFIGLALERTQEDPAAAARLLGIPEQRIGGALGSEPPTPETP